MIDYPFTQKNLTRRIQYRDIQRHPQLGIATERAKLGAEAAERISGNKVFRGSVKKIQVRGKDAYRFGTLHAELTARLIARNIRSNYGIRFPNRHSIVRNLTAILKEDYPAHVHRADIQSFFESVNRDAIIPKLLNDNTCSQHTIILLAALFDELKRLGVLGLPRGLGISSVLAEFVLRDFDKNIKSHPEIFYYARFVDDIIVLTSKDLGHSAINEMLAALPSPLQIHGPGSGKRTQCAIQRVSQKNGETQKLNYLGYSFTIHGIHSISDIILHEPRRKIEIEISQDKINKIKARIHDSFISFVRSKGSNFSLLKDRLKALTGNYLITDSFTGIKIRTGIYYNYELKNKFNNCMLSDLDSTLRGYIFSRKHTLSHRIGRMLTPVQIKELAGLSFTYGFHRRTFHKFSYGRLLEIKECWKK